jgi:hypothetical protein
VCVLLSAQEHSSIQKRISIISVQQFEGVVDSTSVWMCHTKYILWRDFWQSTTTLKIIFYLDEYGRDLK